MLNWNCLSDWTNAALTILPLLAAWGMFTVSSLLILKQTVVAYIFFKFHYEKSKYTLATSLFIWLIQVLFGSINMWLILKNVGL